MWGKLSTTCSNLLKQHNGELMVAVDHNLRTMTSETVDPIDRSLPRPSWAVPPERLVHSINRCSTATAGIRSCNLATFSMQGNHLVYAATQGISLQFQKTRLPPLLPVTDQFPKHVLYCTACCASKHSWSSFLGKVCVPLMSFCVCPIYFGVH